MTLKRLQKLKSLIKTIEKLHTYLEDIIITSARDLSTHDERIMTKICRAYNNTSYPLSSLRLLYKYHEWRVELLETQDIT